MPFRLKTCYELFLCAHLVNYCEEAFDICQSINRRFTVALELAIEVCVLHSNLLHVIGAELLSYYAYVAADIYRDVESFLHFVASDRQYEHCCVVGGIIITVWSFLWEVSAV